MSDFSEKLFFSSSFGDTAENIPKERSLFKMGLSQNSIFKWDQISQPPKTDLLVSLDRMVKNYTKTDLQVLIGDEIFNCHKIVLQAYSKLFYETPTEAQTVRLAADKITPGAFSAIYEWMISSNPVVKRQGILQLFIAARYLKISELVEQCWSCFDSDNFIEDQAFLLYLEARFSGETMIMELMISRISKFFLTLVASKEFLSLSPDEVCSFLKCSQIAVHSELEVLYSGLRWIFHDWESRQSEIVKVISCIRFALIPPWQLVEFSRTSDCSEIAEIMKYGEVIKMVRDSLDYIVSDAWYRKLNNADVAEAMERLKLNGPIDRVWIDDKVFHKFVESKGSYVYNYDTFLTYLDTIKDLGIDFWRSMKHVDPPLHMTDMHNYEVSVSEIVKKKLEEKSDVEHGVKLN
ncbi:actin-binding protein IPP [Culicoides brevitarsis]|uniref:actin-binding protein IPP n=1 Tax=Culicoides brevitarsis TaxID=469753 RepID=UPI00307C6AE5